MKVCDRCQERANNGMDVHRFAEGTAYTEKFDVCDYCLNLVKALMAGDIKPMDDEPEPIEIPAPTAPKRGRKKKSAKKR